MVGLCILDLLIRRELGDRRFKRPVVRDPDVIEAFRLDFSDDINSTILQDEFNSLQ